MDGSRVSLAHRHPWRAGCAGTRSPGSEGGPAKRTLRKEGTARRSDPYALAWLSRCRAILIRWDKKACNYLGLLKLACALLWFRRYHRLAERRRA